MAIIQVGDQKREIPDGSKGPEVEKACKEMGIPFGCEMGACGECLVTVEEGAENLSELTDYEEAADLDKNTRRICACTVKTGLVKIKHVGWSHYD